ncbi:hypothetical protein J7T55_013832 [Diaporthe amygdali]|uniref:uncharacterized protein n=1 Tax=Phomopsis amygdali TaxID=1214568 RepID=UPI0022FDE7C9|nr:uncharacterized protein J7T55_013832 [Diaporthe amygdali]KAJ0119629.1 hypothetical protein J7T55_013832 [Diaporthe amygdali]
MHRSDRYICILLGALCLTGTSIYYTRGLKDDHAAFFVHVVASTSLYVTSVISLSFATEEDARLQAKVAKLRQRKRAGLRPYQYWPLELATLSTRVTGLLGGLYTFALPLVSPFKDPIVDVAIRIPTFFYSCKLLDLSVARARKPPVPCGAQDIEAYGLVSWRAHGANAWRLLTETRYASFNIAVDESARKAVEQKDAAWSLIPWLALPLAYLFPAAAEAQVVSGLLGIQLGIEGLHSLLHPRCPNWLFCRPFSSAGLLEFWTCRWHQGAQPFLYSLGYAPVRRVVAKLFGPDVGRAAGVLGAFSLSGVWHAWSGAALTRAEYVWHVSVGLWFLFILQGLGCLVEKRLSRDVSRSLTPFSRALESLVKQAMELQSRRTR